MLRTPGEEGQETNLPTLKRVLMSMGTTTCRMCVNLNENLVVVVSLLPVSSF